MTPRVLEIALEHAMTLIGATLDGFQRELDKARPPRREVRAEYEAAFAEQDPATAVQAFIGKYGEDEFLKQAGLAVQRQRRTAAGG